MTTMNDVVKVRWSEAQVLAEARKRTKELTVDHPSKLQKVLGNMLIEAVRTEEQFIDALCQDVIKRGGKRA